jgi:uncharacterized membrane protein
MRHGGYAAVVTLSTSPGARDQAPLNQLAVVAFVLAFFAGIVGVIIGAIALREIARTGQRGRKLAVAAILIGSVLAIAFVGGAVVVFFSIIDRHGCAYPC